MHLMQIDAQWNPEQPSDTTRTATTVPLQESHFCVEIRTRLSFHFRCLPFGVDGRLPIWTTGEATRGRIEVFRCCISSFPLSRSELHR